MGTAPVTILGNYDPDLLAHAAIRDAIIHAERKLGCVLDTRWVTLDELYAPADVLDGTRMAILASHDPKGPHRLHPELLDAISWLRDHRVPTLGIESGYFYMAIEFARVVLGHGGANARFFDETTDYPIISRLDDERPSWIVDEGPEVADIEVFPDTRLSAIYSQSGIVREAVRGDAAFNSDYLGEFERAGIVFPARARHPQRSFVAAMEWNALPFYVGVAFLPQFASRPEHSHPLLEALVAEAL